MEIFLLRDGEQIGPFDEASVQAMISKSEASAEDYAWRNGLSAWIPLKEVLSSSARDAATPPPKPPDSGIRRAPVSPASKITPKQRALLTYLVIPFSATITKEEAAVLVSDALENPALFARLGRWNREKFQLHPEIFADELDAKRQQRAAYYFEQCQIEGKDFINGLTEAHCKVLVESLDNRYPRWETSPREALWEFFLPTVSEHFPQMVTPEWRSKLKVGGSKIPGALNHAIQSSKKLSQRPASPGLFQAALRGLVYGAVMLGVIFGGLYLAKNRNNSSKTAAEESEDKSGDASDKTKGSGASTASSQNAALSDSATMPSGTESPAVDPATSTDPNLSATPQPTSVPQPAAPRTSVVLRKSVKVRLQFGEVTLKAGQQLKFVAAEDPNVRVQFGKEVFLVPASFTDLSPTELTSAPAPQ
jgi:hypothetical protein